MRAKQTRAMALAAAVGVAIALLAGWLLLVPSGAQRAQARGLALYEGRVELPAALSGHERALPTNATRCVNCHAPTPDGGAAAARAALNSRVATPAARQLAPTLDASLLTQTRARRNGPPSVYDVAALCKLLRTGVDPAGVMLPAAMPRYQATDAQCGDLWAHFSAR